jgi:hypothetical protein
MKISRIEVENFRSIKKYDFKVADFNVFVGQNNHGKTNLFEAIDWFNSGKTESSNFYNHEKDNPIKIRVTYEDVQNSLNSLENEAYKKAIQGVLGENNEFVMEKTSDGDKRAMIVNGVCCTGVCPFCPYRKACCVTVFHYRITCSDQSGRRCAVRCDFAGRNTACDFDAQAVLLFICHFFSYGTGKPGLGLFVSSTNTFEYWPVSGSSS